MKKLLYQFKYAPYVTDLQTVLGDLLYEKLIQEELFMQFLQTCPVVIPIPLSKKKLQKRGYNQSEILAKNLAKRFDLQFANRLERVKETKPQYGLKREERQENMKNAFQVNIKYKTQNRKKTALLIDDVVTTGSTLLEAVKVLKINGFREVYGVVLAQD